MRHEKYDQIGPEGRALQFAAGKPGGLGADIQIEFSSPGPSVFRKGAPGSGLVKHGLIRQNSVLYLERLVLGVTEAFGGFLGLAVP